MLNFLGLKHFNNPLKFTQWHLLCVLSSCSISFFFQCVTFCRCQSMLCFVSYLSHLNFIRHVIPVAWILIYFTFVYKKAFSIFVFSLRIFGVKGSLQQTCLFYLSFSRSFYCSEIILIKISKLTSCLLFSLSSICAIFEQSSQYQ